VYLIAVMAATLVPTLLATRPGLLPRPPLAFPPPLSLLMLSVTHGLTVRSPASLISGALFLYGTRHVERLSSSAVHGARLAAAAALYAAYTLVVGAAGVGVSPGPWGVMGVLVLDMAIEVPPLLGGPAPGVGVGDTGVMVGLALLALLLGGPGAAAAAAGGLLVGVVLRLGRGGAALRSPPRVPLLAQGGSPSAAAVDGQREPAADGRGGADEEGGDGGVTNGTGREGAAGGVPVAPAEEPVVGGEEEEEPADEGVAALAAMGFSVERSREALAAAGGDAQTAAEMLLAGGT